MKAKEVMKILQITRPTLCKYVNCINNYYKLNGDIAEKISDESEEEVAKKYNLEKSFHWTNFWQLVMTNMEGWSING